MTELRDFTGFSVRSYLQIKREYRVIRGKGDGSVQMGAVLRELMFPSCRDYKEPVSPTWFSGHTRLP